MGRDCIGINLQGMSVLWLTAILPQARPPPCKHKKVGEKCVSPSSAQLALPFSAFVLMSVGAGGIRPCSLAFGADQFNQPVQVDDLKVKKKISEDLTNLLQLVLCFSWNLSDACSDSNGLYTKCKRLGCGFWNSCCAHVVLFHYVFFLGSPLYIKMKAKSSLLTGFAQVIVATWRNRHLSLPVPPLESDGWFHHKASKLTAPTDNLRYSGHHAIRKIMPFISSEIESPFYGSC